MRTGSLSVRSKKDLPLRHFSSAIIYFLFPLSLSRGEFSFNFLFFEHTGFRQFAGLFGQNGWQRGVCYVVLTLWQCVCRSVHQITKVSGFLLTHRRDDLLTCERDKPAGPIIIHYWRIHWRPRWIDAGLLKGLPTAMAAVIYACLCPLGFYLHISSLRASIHPFPPHDGSLPCTLRCTGIIVIGILKTHCFTCSLASFYISASLI